jgi:hypothetical protein
MSTMITAHPTAKRTADGYIPMITFRGRGGRMLGSQTPQGDARAFRTFLDPVSAEIEARLIALRCSQLYPTVIKVA